jgi:RNA polymerase sigma-70 factor (ECF subfamily)
MPNWEQIMAEEGPTVWQTLWRLLSDRADVEDCFQETFVSALHLSQREAVTSWRAALIRLATARGMDRLRQRYRSVARLSGDVAGRTSPSLAVNEITSKDAGPVEQAVVSELSERLRQALTTLPEKQAEVFYLFAIDGWTHREIGTHLQMTENAVGVNVHRARVRLLELLEDRE